MAGEFAELLLARFPHQVAAVGHCTKGAGADHLLLFDISIHRKHVGLVADDSSLLGHLSLKFVPEALQVLGGRKLLAASQSVEKFLALGDLGADQRVPGLATEIRRDLADHAEEFTHLSDALGQLGFVRSDLDLVVVVDVLEALARGFLPGEAGPGFVEEELLVLLPAQEVLLARAVLRDLGVEAQPDHFEELIEGDGVRRRGCGGAVVFEDFRSARLAGLFGLFGGLRVR